MLLTSTGQSAFDADVRKLYIESTLNLASAFLDTSFTFDALSGGDYFSSASQVANEIVNAPFKRWHIGKSKFSDAHGLMDSSTECGWTSTEISGVAGAFSTSPVLEQTFSSRSVEKITVRGDDQWEDYPVDFTVELYYSGSYHTEITITGNASVGYEYPLPVTRTYVTKAKLTVSKWSVATRPCKIYEFSVSRIITLDGDDIYDFSILEEANYSGDTLPVGKISSNQLSMSFYDDGSILLSEMRRNKAVTLSISAELSGVEYPVSLGRYYVKDWQIDSLNKTITITCFDAMSILAEDTYSSTLQVNKTAKELAEAILADSQLGSSLYTIDDELSDFVVPLSIFPQMTHQEALAQVVSFVLGSAYVDRATGILTIKGPTATASDGVSDKTFTNTSHVLQTETPVELNGIATVIDVNWYEIVIAGSAADVIESTETLSVPAGGTAQMLLTFPTDYITVSNVGTPTFTQSGSDITISSYTAYVWGVSINFANSGAAAQDVLSITVNGKPVTYIQHACETTDSDAIGKYGRLKYTYDNLLVQSRVRAQAIGTAILTDYADPTDTIISDLWGAPYVLIGDTVTVPDRDGANQIAHAERQEFSFNENGLSHRLTTKIVS